MNFSEMIKDCKVDPPFHHICLLLEIDYIYRKHGFYDFITTLNAGQLDNELALIEAFTLFACTADRLDDASSRAVYAALQTRYDAVCGKWIPLRYSDFMLVRTGTGMLHRVKLAPVFSKLPISSKEESNWYLPFTVDLLGLEAYCKATNTYLSYDKYLLDTCLGKPFLPTFISMLRRYVDGILDLRDVLYALFRGGDYCSEVIARKIEDSYRDSLLTYIELHRLFVKHISSPVKEPLLANVFESDNKVSSVVVDNQLYTDIEECAAYLGKRPIELVIAVLDSIPKAYFTEKSISVLLTDFWEIYKRNI